MKLKRIMIAAPKSGSGKTLITCALLHSLREQGVPVVSYKCGPDYIDPMFHETVLGVPSKNLDTFFTDEETSRRLFLNGRKEDEIAVLEGVMGLFDGLGGIYKNGSSYHLAQVTKTPIILVIDGKGMGRSILALICGFLDYDPAHLIRGIFLNRISKSYFSVLEPLIEEELGIPVLGYLEENAAFQIKSRHLGLKTPAEIAEIQELIRNVSADLRKNINAEQIFDIMRQAEELPDMDADFFAPAEELDSSSPVIAVAKDEAFCFYYEDNLNMLKKYGAELQYFSPVHDEKLPDGCSGLLLGGGYPELYAKALSENHTMLESIRTAFHRGLPTVAECGGFMYLHREIKDTDSIFYPMVGVLPETCTYTGRLVRFGYLELEETNSRFLPEHTTIRGHEFHYYDSTDNGNDWIARKPVTGRTYPCAVTGESYWLGFPHLYYPSNPAFAERFVEMCHRFGKRYVFIENSQ